jgi:hypothetical protein
MLGNPDASASLLPGQRLAGLRLRGLIADDDIASYRALMRRLYAPKLAEVGFDPAAGAYAAETPDRQKFRQDLVQIVAGEADDPATIATLASAAKAYLAGDAKALDQGFMLAAFAADVKLGGLPAAKALLEAAVASEDPVLRGAAVTGLAVSGRADVGAWIFGLQNPRLRPLERLRMLAGLATTAETHDMAGDWILANYDLLAKGGNGVFIASRLPSVLGASCSAARADQVAEILGPKVKALGAGQLDFDRTVESIRHCGELKAARQVDLGAALKAAS